jgi:rod shape-determining protein MreC
MRLGYHRAGRTVRYSQPLFFRTIFLWTVLELLSAWQVRSPAGTPVLFSWLRAVANPIIAGIEGVGGLVADIGVGLSDLQRVIADNQQMRLELEDLRARHLLLQEDLIAQRETSDLVNTGAEFQAGSIVARCAYRDLGAGTMEVRTSDKIFVARDAPAVGAHGLIGRVVRSEGHRHWIQLLTHAAAAVAVQTDDGSVQGLALGTGTGRLTIAYVPRQATLERGTVLMTSGGDGIFPPGIPAVQIVRVRESDDPFLEVNAISSADLRTTRVVLLLSRWSARADGE